MRLQKEMNEVACGSDNSLSHSFAELISHFASETLENSDEDENSTSGDASDQEAEREWFQSPE